MHRAVVFDLDGTLLDSHSSVLTGLRYAIEPFGGPPIDRRVFASLGGPPETFIHRLVHDKNHAPAALARLLDFFRLHGHEVEPYPEVHETLNTIRQEGIQLAIWTGRDRASTESLLARFAWGTWFSEIICGDDLSTHKPDPAGMFLMLKRMKVDRSDAIFVGDADVDARAGKASGVQTLLIQDGRDIPTEVRNMVSQVCEDHMEAYAAAIDWSRGYRGPNRN